MLHAHVRAPTHPQGCSAHFSSLMGYQYHQKRCGRELSEEDKPVFLCQHCGKTYRSKAGRDYHLRTEHRTPTTPNTTNTTNINNTNNTNTSRGVRESRSGFVLYLYRLRLHP